MDFYVKLLYYYILGVLSVQILKTFYPVYLPDHSSISTPFNSFFFHTWLNCSKNTTPNTFVPHKKIYNKEIKLLSSSGHRNMSLRSFSGPLGPTEDIHPESRQEAEQNKTKIFTIIIIITIEMMGRPQLTRASPGTNLKATC